MADGMADRAGFLRRGIAVMMSRGDGVEAEHADHDEAEQAGAPSRVQCANLAHNGTSAMPAAMKPPCQAKAPRSWRSHGRMPVRAM